MVLTLLNGLPAKWQTIKELVMNTGELDWENAVSMLYKNESLINQPSIGTSQNNTEGALVAKGGYEKPEGRRATSKGNRNRRGTNTNSTLKSCFYCTKKG